MKYSKQREVVYETVITSHEHPTALMVYNIVLQKIPNISLGTIYRNLSQLEKEALIRRITMPDNNDRFDKTLSNHCHLSCIKCQKIYDISEQTLSLIKKEVYDNMNFTVTSPDIVFKGICHNCEERKNLWN